MVHEEAPKMTIYRVTGTTIHWSQEQTIGYYSKEETARKVVDLVREINKQEVPGLDVKFQKYEVEVKRSPLGFCLNNSEEGCGTLIKEALNRDELQRIIDMHFNKHDVEAIKL